MHELPFATRYDPASAVLAVQGSIEPELADDLASAMDAAADRSSRVTIDLSEVTYLPSIGVAVLVQAMKKAVQNAVDLVLVAAPDTAAERVLAVTGVPHRVSLVGDDLLPGPSC